MTDTSTSAVYYVRREQEKEINRRLRATVDAESKHVGELKERLRGIAATVTFVREFGDEDDLYGTRTLVKFRDAEGNVFEWWSSQAWDEPIGTEVLITGTVKKHGEYNGVKSTTLSRCALEITKEVVRDGDEN